MFGWERRSWPGLTTLALDRRHERCFLTADKRSSANPDLDAEVEARFENPGSQKAMLFGLTDGDLQTTNSQRVFGADVDEPLLRTNCTTRNCHALEYSVRIALQNAAVHKCARIALVPVANDILAFARRFRHGCPLQTSRVAGPAAPAQPALRDLLNDLPGLHFKQNPMESAIAARLDVLLDVLRIHPATAGQNHRHLASEKSMFRVATSRFGYTSSKCRDD